MSVEAETPPHNAPVFNYIVATILVSIAWGFTTPFIRRGAVNFSPPIHPSVERVDTSTKAGWVKKKILGGLWTVFDLLKTPAYAIPLVINLTGSVWFFVLLGSSGRWPNPLLTNFPGGFAQDLDSTDAE